MKTDETNHAKAQAKAQYESICGMVEALRKARLEEGHDQYLAIDQAREDIQNDALDVCIRSTWTPIGQPMEADEYRILLCTGGPACRIRGELNQHAEPDRAWLEYQDWGTPWMQYFDASQDVLLAYARQFYFSA